MEGSDRRVAPSRSPRSAARQYVFTSPSRSCLSGYGLRIIASAARRLGVELRRHDRKLQVRVRERSAGRAAYDRVGRHGGLRIFCGAVRNLDLVDRLIGDADGKIALRQFFSETGRSPNLAFLADLHIRRGGAKIGQRDADIGIPGRSAASAAASTGSFDAAMPSPPAATDRARKATPVRNASDARLKGIRTGDILFKSEIRSPATGLQSIRGQMGRQRATLTVQTGLAFFSTARFAALAFWPTDPSAP